MSKKNKGITLIALIITIVVLLILVAVSVNVLIKSNLIGIAEKTVKKDSDATIFEEVEIAYAGALTGQYLENAPFAEIMRRELAKKDDKTEVLGERENIIVKYKEHEIILKDGKLTEENQVKQVTDTTPGELAGKGTAEEPYLVQSIEDLVAFSNNVNNGTSYEGQYVNLELTLDFKSEKSYVDPSNMNALITGSGFTPIGGKGLKFEYTSGTAEAFGEGRFTGNFFKGTFNGNGNYIKNLYVNGMSDESNSYGYVAGLFGANAGTIKNLNVTGEVTGTMSNSKKMEESTFGVGGIAGGNVDNGTIENCSNYATIKANASVICHAGAAGITAGNYYSNVSNCRNYGSVTMTSNDSEDYYYACGLGGIVAGSYGNSNVIGCSNYGTIKNEGGCWIGAIGGLVGAASGNTHDESTSKTWLTIQKSNNYGVVRPPVKVGKYADCVFCGDFIGILGLTKGMNYLKNCKNSYDIEIDGENEMSIYYGPGVIMGAQLTVENCKSEGTHNLNNATQVVFSTCFGESDGAGGAIAKNYESNVNININVKSQANFSITGYTDALDGDKYNGKIQIFADKITGNEGFEASIEIRGKNNSYWLNNEQKHEKYKFSNELM